MAPRAKPKRSPCPVACTLDVVGDRWTLLVVRDMLMGRSQFKEFMASPERIASNILAERLERLVSSGLAETYASAERGDRFAYRLTARGLGLRPVLDAIAAWGLSSIAGTRAHMRAVEVPR